MPGEISPADKHSQSGASPELLASHADREQVVELLRVGAGEGRLTVDELGERVEAALKARTLGELAELTADLPAGEVAEDRDVVRIDQRFSPVKREGAWVVPRRIELQVEWSKVTLDFTQAVITRDTLQIDMDMRGQNLTLIVRPGIVVDSDALRLDFSKVKYRHTPDPAVPVALRVVLTGEKFLGRVVVKEPR